jgi:hypothetical protein
MSEPAPVKELAAFSGMLCLFLLGVSYTGAKSLKARKLEHRVRPWLFELWLVAVAGIGLFVLSGRLVGWNFVGTLGSLEELKGGTTTFALAVVGALVGLGCVFRMLALVREGIGTFAMDDDNGAGGASRTPGGEGEESDGQ